MDDEIDKLVASLLAHGLPDGPAAIAGEQWLHRLDTLRALLNVFDGSFSVTVTRADGIDVYVQVAREGSAFVAEAVSNEYLSAAGVLGPEQVSRLLDLGWSPPIDDDSPNFVRRVQVTPRSREELAAVLALTLRDVYGVAAGDEWGLLPATLLDKLMSYQAAVDGTVADLVDLDADSGPEEVDSKASAMSHTYSADMNARFLYRPEAALDWRHFDIREAGRITAAAAYRPGEYVYCQRGPDDGLQAAAEEGLARDEVPTDPSSWNEPDTYRALIFGVARNEGRADRVLGSDGVAQWDSPEDALNGVIRILSSDLDETSTVTTYAFPSQEVGTRRVEPDPAARKERKSAEEEARAQAARGAARADEERRALALQDARRQAHEAAIRQAEQRAQEAKELTERLSVTDLVTAEDLLAAFAAVGDGPYYLADWGRAIIDSVERFTGTKAVDPLSGTLFSVLKDAAEKRYQFVTPFQGILEAPPEVIEIHQAHADALEHLLAVRDEVLSKVLSDLARRLIGSLGDLRWGELARYDAIRAQPSRPAGFDDFDD